MILIAVSMTTILMFLAFGSLVLPMKAALMNALTLVLNAGRADVDIRRRPSLSGLLNFTPTPLDRSGGRADHRRAATKGAVDGLRGLPGIPCMVEARARGMTTEEAIRVGTATTGRLITARGPDAGRGRGRVRVLRPGDDEVPGVRPPDRAAARTPP